VSSLKFELNHSACAGPQSLLRSQGRKTLSVVFVLLTGRPRTRLAPYKPPRRYAFVSDHGRDDAAEVRRTQLRDERVARMKVGVGVS